MLTDLPVHSNQRISKLPSVIESELHLLQDRDNTTPTDSQSRCVHELFEARAEETPDSVAVQFGDRQLTYRQMNEQANRLAHRLIELGVGPETLVALSVERSPDMIVALLGILKAGGAYVPLDPAYPAARLQFILADSRPAVLLTERDVLRHLPACAADVVVLDTWDTSAYSGLNPGPRATADNLAYVIYTSGSTGIPKGVQIGHRGLSSFLQSMRQQPGLDQHDGLLALTTLSFDIAALEIFLPLTVGARVILVSREVAADGHLLQQALSSHSVTTVQATPATWHMLLESGWQGNQQLVLLCGGEALSRQLAESLLQRGKDVWNMYGPTETTIWSTLFRVESGNGPVPIGQPIANTQVHVLDEDGQPVPHDSVGELCIGGIGLARGYMNRPELTAEKFVTDCFSNQPGTRLYRTGDLARWRTDGQLECLGRIDQQVKLRGFRIELGEIEAALCRHSAIVRAVVQLREDRPAEKQLVAYLVPSRQEAQPGTSELREFLTRQLPEYMIPATFVWLDSLPLTPNGKVDRLALPAPECIPSGRDLDPLEPRTPLEELLAGIWSEVLHRDRLGIHDNFFELGGHSLLATRIATCVRLGLGFELPIRAVFENPTVAGLAWYIDRRRATGTQQLADLPLACSPRSGPVLPAYAQERLWFLDQLEPGQATYNLSWSVRLSGCLNVAALERSLHEIVRRHEALRTTFQSVSGQPMQVIAAEFECPLPLVDLCDLPENERPATADRLAQGQAARPFDLSRDLMLRAQLLRLDVHEHWLLLTVHHIAADGWSWEVFGNELAALYSSSANGQPTELPMPAVQYADYAHWQRQWLKGDVLDRQLAYWKQQLSGAPAILELPTDFPRPPVRSDRGAACDFVLTPELTGALKSLSRRENVTLFMTLLAAWKVLLSRYSRQEDISVGAPAAGRSRPELESLIGFFVNTLVLRTDLAGNPTFRELLTRVREVTLDAYAHQDLPFEKLVAELQPERDLSQSPLFQAMFALQNAPSSPWALDGLSVRPLPLATTTAKFDLTLELVDSADGLRGQLEYSTDLFEAATIDRLLGHYVVLLTGIVADPGHRIGELPLLSDAERCQILVEWNDTVGDFPRDKCLHELFEAQVAQTPDAVAVAVEDQQFTYCEVNARANRLAQSLIELGVGPETLVALCVERSPLMIVSLLAILKAGGAYVPLDPSYPATSLQFMLQDSGAPVLLTQSQLLESLPDTEARIVCADRMPAQSDREPIENPNSRAYGDNLAYVIYTSGSTGQPKGVQLTHRGIVNLLHSMSREPGLTAHDVLLAVTTLSFDIAGLEVFLPLTTGARVQLVSRNVAVDGVRLSAELARHGATVVQATPATWRLLVESGWQGTRNLKILCGGEALSPDLAEQLRVRCGSLWNMYGPTETTIWSTVHRVDAPSAGISIGRPIANTRAHVLDSRGLPVPIGVPGELYLGGAGLARGYWKRAELTAEKFVADPFSDNHAARLYRTGDLVRWKATGDLEYRGRVDQQIKLRGFRIEPGEIESILRQLPQVSQSLVVLREDHPGDMRLVAYMVPAPQSAIPSTDDLRDYLANRLPEFMIPSAFVALAELPLTLNGKVDRKALPAPDSRQWELHGGDVAPRTPLEELLADIWCDVLHLGRIGINDNFFELGGHSLLATQVVSRTRAALHVEFPVRVLFEAPTVAGLASRVEALRSGEPQATSVPLQRVPRNGAIPASFAQERLWFLDQLQPGLVVYNLSWGKRLAGRLQVPALELSLRELVRRHEALRTTLTAENGQPHLQVLPAEEFRLVAIDLRSLPATGRPAAARKLAEELAHRPFDLSGELPLRAQLIQLDEDEHWLHLEMHHIASDGWSLGIIERELTALYAAHAAGLPSPLPELAVQYVDYAVWQRHWLDGDVLERQLAYWRQRLAGAPAVLELPTDFPRPAVSSYRGATCEVALPKELTAALHNLSRRENATLFMTLLAAWQVLLSRYSRQEDVSVGVPIAGRTHEELEKLIGFFVNTLVLRTELSGNPTFRDLLARVRESTLDAYAHQDLPFEKLVEELQPERNLNRNSLFQVLFVLQNTPPADPVLDGLTLYPLPLDTSTAKFDLTLTLQESAQCLRGTIGYNTDLFESATIDRMLGHFRTLLASIATDPGQSIGELPLLTDAERHQIITTWNDTGAEFSNAKCLHELFEAQVERTPDAVAAVCADRELSYRELNDQANVLAQRLIDQGTGPEILVGLCVERSLEMLVGLLGILKAGGAYVPLDPDLPTSRLEYIVADSNLRTIVTTSHHAGLFAGQASELVFVNELPRPGTGARPNPASRATAGDPVYLLYTSGSTGNPKGVIVEHGQLGNYVHAVVAEYGMEQGGGFAMVQPLTVDSSQTMIFPALGWGGTIHLVSRELSLDAAALAQYFSGHAIDYLKIAPSHLSALLTADQPRRLLPFRGLIIGGEALHWTLVSRLAELRPECRVWNHYGPTETTVGVFTYPIHLADDQNRRRSATVPIGHPLANVTCYVLDSHESPVPDGVIGELYIGGSAVARGYRNRPELTAQQFVPDRFGESHAGRLYRSGDFVRRLPSGDIEFLGRQDGQLKIRGIRIETGEIEAALHEHADVRDSIVVLWPGATGDPFLAAYVVLQAACTPSTSRLREHLARRLPEVMRPAAYIFLNELPRTPHGKLNRQALPAPVIEQLEADQVDAAPRTDVEERLARIWAEMLGVESVGIHRNFFDLGGHSLLAIRVIARVREEFSVELPIRSLFESPTVAGLAATIEPAISKPVTTSSIPLRPVLRQGRFPLSFAQERLWFLDQLEPGGIAYNIPAGVRLRGPVNVTALEQSLQELVARHEILRTTFAVTAGIPAQVVADCPRVSLETIDLRGIPFAEREPRALRLAEEEWQRPFDLSRGPLLRTQLLRLHEQEHWLILTFHHIASDGWSSDVLWREWPALYGDFSAGRPSSLPLLPVQYADYAVWQRQSLQGDVLEQQLTYWKRQLAGAPEVLELPTDFPRPAVLSHSGATQELVLDAKLTQALQAVSRRENVTLFMTLLAAWQVLLSRYCRQEDVSIGTPVAGRRRTELDGLIGFFINMLVLRTDLSGNPPFRELLRQVREVALGALAHQDLPFEKLVEELHPQRNPSHSPLFQVAFALQNTPPAACEFTGLTSTPLEIPTTTAKFDLTLSLAETASGLSGTLEYNTDLFEAATIARLLGHFQVLLAGIADDPGRPIGEYPLLTPVERQQILVEWNNTATNFPRDKCLYQLFEEQVERSPDAPAVVFEGELLTYRELNSRVNRLARYLIDRGLGQERLVAICLERSSETIVSILGVIKAGCAYLPLDADAPAARLTRIISDAMPAAVLTTNALRGQFPETATVLSLDDARTRHDLSQFADSNPVDSELSAPRRAEQLAYVIYTSGSTGTPKGIEILQHSVIGLVINTNYIAITADDAVAQLSNTAFDAATFEIWGALLNGAKLVILTRELLLEPVQLMTAFQNHGVTVALVITQLFNQIVAQLPHAFAGLRCLLVGGERSDAARFREVLRQGPPQQFLHAYGPSEATTIASVFPVSSVPPDVATIPIGRAISNDRLYVMDPWGQPAPVGVPGELWTGGAGLARGYLNHSELTAEKFVADPFSNTPGARVFRTGDLVRWRADGNLEFLERLDHQVKLRGFRIELEEIEAVLARHPNVRQAVVQLREDQPGEKSLVAYLVSANAHPQVAPTDLRDFLKDQLPTYMVPSAFVVLDKVPLTRNGKVDRQALPAPDSNRRALDLNLIAPRTAMEELLTDIWCDVLGLARVGIHDNFFELGGHSLLATQVASRIRTAFSIELPVRALFEVPTVAELAGRVETLRSQAELPLPRTPLHRVPQSEALSPSFAQERLWFLEQLEPGLAVYNISWGFRLTGQLQVAALEDSLRELVRRHDVLRTTFAAEDGQPHLQVLSADEFRPIVIELRSLPEEGRAPAARQLAEESARRPFDLSHELMLRAQFIQLAEEECWLVLVLHHIAADGWSRGVLERELTTLYEAYSKSRPSPLPLLPVQYADYAVWQRDWLQGEVLQRQVTYWKQQLAGVPAVLELPTDFPRPAVPSYRGATRQLLLDADLSAALHTLSHRENATLFMTLLAAWQVLLSRYSNQVDVSVGAPIAGRTQEELEGLIGFFVNTLVLRTDLSGNPTFRELLAQVRETTLDAYAHQDLPFEKLVAELQPERRQSHSPLFQVMFVLQNAPTAGLNLSGLAISPLPLSTETSKFDLLLALTETTDGMCGALEYSTDLFEAATIDRLLGHFQVLLKGIVADPGQRIGVLPLLTETERRQALIEWNDTAADYPLELCLHELFEAQVARTPDAVALVCAGRQLTYRELNEKANQLAHYLREQGVKPDVPVGICLERGVALVAAILGILKSGAAYLPLDPTYPPQRLRLMFEEARVPLIVTEPHLVGILPEGSTALVYGEGDNPWDRQSVENLSSVGDSLNLAYVLYTSGSTGIPKGVAMQHRSLVNLMLWQVGESQLASQARTLQFASVNFDVSAQEIFATLSSGGTLVLVDEMTRRDPVQLWQFIVQERIQRLFLPFVALQNLVEAASLADIRGNALREIVTAGEQLHVTPAMASFFGELENCRLYNHYGPTETHVITSHRLNGPPAGWPLLPPIGSPVANVRIYVLNEQLQPVPPGVIGQLYAGGVCVARGYWNRADFTAERFLADPFSDESLSRLYRTGDLARWRSDGQLEFLGRIDHQVKHRGFRVELGEIEAALEQHDQVQTAVVLLREDRPGDKRLTAYVVPRSAASSPDAEELRRRLAEKLPDYMVPTAFVVLDKLPVNTNGKVDRQMLPAPLPAKVDFDAKPRTDLEQTIATVFSDVLGIDGVDLDDSFFELGGNSLLAVQLQARLGKLLHIRLPLRRIFETPQVRGLAERIAQESQTISPVMTVPPPPTTDLPNSEQLAENPVPGPSSTRRLYRFLALSDHALARGARRIYWGLRTLSLPAPRVLVAPLRWAFIALRSVYFFLWRVFFCEPIFKSYCLHYGRRLHTGYFIHWVQGNGDIVIGDDVAIDGKCSFTFAARFTEHPTLSIGNRTGIGHNCMFTVGKQIRIGNQCRIASDVWMFDSGGHSLDPDARSLNIPLDSEAVRPIEIGDNVWIGRRSVIFPGVTIGEGSVVAACSVVMSSVPPYSLVSGHPAKVVGELERQARPAHSDG
jgi:amino acid adenylation domain-containing protein